MRENNLWITKVKSNTTAVKTCRAGAKSLKVKKRKGKENSLSTRMAFAVLLNPLPHSASRSHSKANREKKANRERRNERKKE